MPRESDGRTNRTALHPVPRLARSRAGRVLLATALTATFGCAPPLEGTRAHPGVAPLRSAPERSIAPVELARPSQMAAYLHVENVRSWMQLFGTDLLTASHDANSPGSGGGSLEEILAALTVFDTSRPIDAGLIVATEDDVEGAVVLPILDREKFLTFMEKDFEILPRKSRYVFKKRNTKDSHDDPDGGSPGGMPSEQKKPEKELACEITESPSRATCGTERALNELGPWLATAPKAAPVDVRLEIDFAPVRSLLEKLLAKDRDKDHEDGLFDPNAPVDPNAAEVAKKRKLDDAKWTASATALVSDLDKITLTASRRGDDVELGFTTTFRSLSSPWISPVFVPAKDLERPDLLFALSENASAAMYSQGGGPVPELVRSLELWKDLPEPDQSKARALQHDLERTLTKPYGAAYGVDLPRVRNALASFRGTKEPEKAQKALAEAVNGYGVLAFSTSLAETERAMREASRLAEAERTRSGISGKAVVKETTKSSFRMASPTLGLPRGSFFVDETKTVEESHGKLRTKKRVTAPDVLATSDGRFTYLVLGLSTDVTYASTAKEILARRSAPQKLDPYFEKKGLLLGGQLSQLVGAFASHEVALKLSPKMATAEREKLAADLERDISSQRLTIPFALTARRVGPGGVLAFDVHGDKLAWKSVSEHVFEGVGGLLMLPLLLATMKP